MASPNPSSNFRPESPHTLQATGLSESFVLDLVLRIAFLEGIVDLRMLAERTRLAESILHGVMRHMQKEQLCEARATVTDNYEFSLTARGRTLAEVALKKTHYVGPAPVVLSEYNEAVSRQGCATDTITQEQLRSALADLVVSDRIIHELGAALVSGGTILLHGSTGNGKTSIAERLHRVFDDFVYIPHAVTIAGQILSVYDPLVHKAVPEQPASADPRWVLCARPMVKVGGEMRAEMLEPRIDEATRICVAPLQMKANNGILLIDDFGRQRITPRELLNRWIVPLDRRTDVLSFWAGISFEIPFEILVVFATNLALTDLAEDAFLRRLRNKIRIEPLSADLFDQLLSRVCEKKGLKATKEAAEYLRKQCLVYAPEGLRPCIPEDITAIIRGIAKFEQRDPGLTQPEIDQALRIYFGA